MAGQCTSVQEDLDSFLAWSHKWKMKFNPAKCNVISISRKSVVPNFQYCLDNIFLQHTDKIVDLGVIIDTKLSTRDHVVKTASKAHTVLGKIKRAVGYDSLDSVKRQLYLSHVRSVLQYCSPVWSPYLVTEIASLEKVQRRATKFIPNDFSDISYRDRCIKLSLLPLSFRKEIHDLCFLFNCIHGKVNCNFSNFINLVDTSTGRRSAQKGILLKIPRVKTTIFYNS